MNQYLYNPALSYTISVSILLLSCLVSALELVRVPSIYLDFVYQSTKVEAKMLKWRCIQFSQASLSILAFLAFNFNYGVIFKILFLCLTVINLYSYLERVTGRDGSDQLRLLTLLSFSLCFLLEDNVGQLFSMIFIGTQVLIGYATSGIVKMLSSYWRRGDVLNHILGTYSYGIPKVADFLRKYPKIEKILTYGAIFTMVFVTISFFLPFQNLLIASLLMMFCFHAATAILMGLNDFLITFPLAYPGILLFHSYIFNY